MAKKEDSQCAVEWRSLDDVRPYENNPRDNRRAVDAVAASIRDFGFRQPIVVDGEGVVIAGHTRLLAAKSLGLDKVPVVVAKDLSPEKVRAYRLADNKTGELAAWDESLLSLEVSELQGFDFDLTDFGFGEKELAKLLEGELKQGLTDPDTVPEPPDDPISRTGDLWILGEHRLLCGDSAKEEDLERLLDGRKIQLVNSDPPYNVYVEPRSNNAINAGVSSFTTTEPTKAKKDGKKAKMRAKDRPLTNDFMSAEEFAMVLNAWFANFARALEPGRAFYLWGGYSNLANYPIALKNNGLYFSQAIVWNKMHPVLTRKDFMGAFEICFYGWREGAGHLYFGPNNATDLWEVKKVNPQSMVHLTEKPVQLAVNAIQYSSKAGENVLDLFGGSGSTLIACEQTGRKGFAMEIDRPYCDVIIKRWQDFTGKDAIRVSPDGSKATYNEVVGAEGNE